MKRGEPADFDGLCAEFRPRIYRFCYRLCNDPTDAEDLVQDVLLLAYRSLAGLESPAAIKTWLYRIALHRWLRVRRRRGPGTVSLAEPLGLHGPPLDAAQHLDRLLLEHALTCLPDPLWQALILVKYEELTYREAAGVLGVPQGTVQWRVHEALLRLRKELLPTESASPDLDPDDETEAEERLSER